MTNELIKVTIENGQAVTSSKIVAESFGKRHDNVLRDIELMKKDVLNFEEMFLEGLEPDSYGRQQPIYFMTRDGFSLLAMGFNGKEAFQFKLKYIQEFNKMEAFLNSPEMIVQRALEIQQQKIRQLTTTIEEQAHKVDAYHHLLNSDGYINMASFAKSIGIGRNTLMKKLREDDVLQEGGYHHNQPYQTFMNRGYFKVVTKVKCGQGYQVSLLTHKGAVWVAKKYGGLGEVA